MRMLLDTMLRREYTVHAYSDVFQAMSWMASGNLPDCILVDIDLPRLNAEELLENLRVSGMYRHIPVVILSGKSDAQAARNLLEKGAQGVLDKPFSRERIFDVLGRILPPVRD